MKTAGILREDSAPGNRHGQKQGIEPGIIETLAEIAACSDKNPLVLIRDRREGHGCFPRSSSTHTALQNDNVLRELCQALCQHFKMILAFRDDHRRTSSFKRGQDVIEDEIIPSLILSEPRVKFLDRGFVIRTASVSLKLGAPENHLVVERPGSSLRPRIDAMTHRAALHENDRVVAILSRHCR